MIKNPKKLIEVALPLKVINEACAREKSIRHGHPSTLHLWWARRPLAAARAVLFAQMVNDPGGERGWKTGLTKEQAQLKRDELFKIIGDLVQWENTNNEEVLRKAREKIMESWRETCRLNAGEPGFNPDVLPAFHDPFAGGGAIPLEAQRLGLESYASDLNPVAVMINKAMIEIPPKFAGRAPIGPIPPGETQEALPTVGADLRAARDGTDRNAPDMNPWPGATGLAEDVRRYGHWMREEAKKRIGHLYPQVEITAEMAADRPDLRPLVGQKLTVIAWLWARTVKSPNPMFSDVDVPLVSSFILSSKKGKEAYVEPVIDNGAAGVRALPAGRANTPGSPQPWHFVVRVGTPPKGAENGTKAPGRSANFYCLMSNAVMDGDYIKAEGCAGRMGARLMAIVCDGGRGRIYISPQATHESVARQANPEWTPSGEVPRHLSGGTCVPYGLDRWHKLFTDRQLVALNTFSDLVQEARTKTLADARQSGWEDDGVSLAQGGKGPTAYADALAVYLTFGVDKTANYCSTVNTYASSGGFIVQTFGRQALPMKWDYAESNPIGDSTGCWNSMIDWVYDALLLVPATGEGLVCQHDAQTQTISSGKLISTDPPYYDNICYADLSDYFYVWMRKGIRDLYPDLFATMAVPKTEELVATAYRHGGKDKAETFFMNGMTATMHNLCRLSNAAFPVTIYYAFKQSETNVSGTSNAGWESFLEAVITAGFVITGTWPMSTERPEGLKTGSNVLASSIILVCRPRGADAAEISKREFLRELKNEMPEALRAMQGLDGSATPVAPVDLAQAAIGPGMEIYSKYKAVLNADGSRMSVHDAIIEINRYLDQGDDFDPETQFCRDWFVEHSWGEGASGDADVLARAKGLAVNDVVDAGILVSKSGKTALMKWQDYPEDYDPTKDTHRPVWEVCHHLVRIHQRHGTGAAGMFLSQVQAQGEQARQLAYVLYTICERKGLAEDARVYNELATGWSDILAASIENAKPTMSQGELEL